MGCRPQNRAFRRAIETTRRVNDFGAQFGIGQQFGPPLNRTSGARRRRAEHRCHAAREGPEGAPHSSACSALVAAAVIDSSARNGQRRGPRAGGRPCPALNPRPGGGRARGRSRCSATVRRGALARHGRRCRTRWRDMDMGASKCMARSWSGDQASHCNRGRFAHVSPDLITLLGRRCSSNSYTRSRCYC